MTKKHYIQIAEILSHSRASKRERLAQAIEFAKLFIKDNPRFDKDRFIAACFTVTDQK